MVNFSYKGKDLEIGASAAEVTVAQALQTITRLVDVAPETLKILYRGHAIDTKSHLSSTLGSLGIKDSSRLLVLGSAKKDVSAVQNSRDLPGLASIDHEEAVHAARRRHTIQHQLPTGPYTFQSFEAWQLEGLSPGPPEALKLLKRLAADPGIVRIMNKHHWQVQKLSEMPPEGKVGVSPVCILGVNINAGQEISLRLRTDDLKGFRRIQSIRQTLCHELAHMVHSEHDNNFKELNSELWSQCEATNSNIRSLLSDSAAGWDEPNSPAVPLDGHRLGSNSTTRPVGSLHPLVARLQATPQDRSVEADQIPGLGHVDLETENKERQVKALLEGGPAQSPAANDSVHSDTSASQGYNVLESSPLDSTLGSPGKAADEAVQRLLSTTEEQQARQALQLLITILHNALSSPTDAKFRRLRLSNPAIKSKLASVEGSLDILATAGFTRQEDGGEAVLLLMHLNPDLLSSVLSRCQSALLEHSKLSASEAPVQA